MRRRDDGDERTEKEGLGFKGILGQIAEPSDVQVETGECYEHEWTEEDLEEVDGYIEYIKSHLRLPLTKEQLRDLILVVAIDQYIRSYSPNFPYEMRNCMKQCWKSERR